MSYQHDGSEETIQHAIPASSIQSSIPKSTITKRNTKAKKGLGTKKVGGLAGKKVTKADFEKLEKSAEAEDKVKRRLSTSSGASDGSNLVKSEKGSGESLRLVYQDLSIQQKQNELKLNKMDKAKKEQAERLGMGMGKTDGVAHSLAMITIDQDPVSRSSRKGRYQDANDTFYDSFSSNKNRRFLWDESDSDDNSDLFRGTDFSYSQENKKSGSKTSNPPPSYTVTPISEGHTADTNIFHSTTKEYEPKNSRQRNNKKTNDSNSDSLDKYKGAKAISSDMLFGSDKELSDKERSQNFSGRSAISSDDFYGRSSSRGQQRSHVDGIKDGVKEGVRSVAGKLSNMASDLASTIQDRYG